MKQKGFSLIELLVVVAIIGIMGLVGYPNIMKWYTKKQLRNDAYELFSSLKDAQQQSMLNKVLYRISIHGRSDPALVISVWATNNPDCGQATYEESGGGRGEIRRISLKNATLTNSGEYHVFSPNGCCLKPHEQHHIPEFILQHKDDRNNGNEFGRYKINITKATCFMNLEKDN